MRRIIFSITIFLFSLSSVMGQMIPINLPADGNWPTIVGDSIMIIGPRQNELTEEQRYFNPIYLMVYPGKEHLKEQMIRAGACDCDPTKPNRRIGVFSVALDKKVSFSQGNLQYLPAINLWKFADTQYEYLGNANKYLKPTFRNWVDLFGWSANNTTAPFGVSTSTTAADYAGDFVDWGTNTICGDAPGTWRTLSRDEWEYLLNGRENANKLRFRAQVNNVNGFVFLPDQWLCPEGIELNIEQLTTQVFTFDAWSKMENAGAVFLPAAGRLNDKQLVNFDDHGNYWSSTRIDNTNVDYFAFTFSTNKLHVDHQSPIHFARSVRLVHDTIVQETIPEPCLVVKVNDTLSINMMCVEGGTFTMGDGENAHPVSLSNYSIGQTEVTQALWEAVMGTTPSANTANKQLPVTNISWYDCQEFIKKLNQQTGMRFRLPTEAEWEYAARGGQKSKGYTYAGSNDLKEVAWYNGNSGNTLHPVAQKKPNELGIYDMSGNVWEWCHDWHAPYPTTHQYNPLGPEVGKVVGKRYLRVFRGGSYGYEAAYHQNAFRDITGPEPNIGTANLGLRLVLSDDVNFETIHVNDTLSFHMMDVKGGTFTMGDDNTSNASPAHQVTLSDYYIGQTEVTQALWKAVMGNVPTGNKNPSYPVGYVSYADCLDFIVKLNKLTSLHFQLPTEAEWEYAAMGGNRSHGYIYSGSNTIDDVAWYDQNSENKLHHVGAKQPNELGIYDMSGNAWEWCADYHGKYTAENQINPQGSAAGTGRVIRSGSFRTTADRCTNKHRQAREADYPDSHITLRLVLHDTVPVLPEPEYVDLGLSVKWATFNVGASKPEDYGDYFAWGETETKDKYSWATYKWCDGTSTNMTKYNTEDGKTILESADDAAQVHWGGKWRMPSKEEVDELTQQCSWIWTTHNNVNGYKVTGPNGNSIFLPAAGYKGSGPTYPAGEDGLYWTNTIEKQHYSYLIVLHDDAPPTQAGRQGTRCFGFAVRAVYDDRPKSKIIWYTDEAIKDGSNRPSITGMAGWAYLHPEGRESTELNRRYQGKRINCIRLQVAQAGTFTISVANRDRLDSIFNIQTIMLKDPSKESQVYHLPQTIHLQKNQVLVFANLTDQARFYYSSNVGDISFADYVGHPDQTVRIAEGPKTLNIDAGYYCEDGDNCDTLAIPEPEYVDLGLSVKWATFNVGATSPEDYGDYFAWGETEPKETYSWATYKWGTSSNLTKYNTTDGKTILDHEDDAAQVHWGGKWRMPTKAECQELIDSCTWEWTTSNNINGYRVTGPNGHSIFLPAGGVRIGNASYAIGEFGYYWSASLMIDSISEAHSIVFTPTSKSCDSDSLYRGRKIRPVYDDRVE